MVNELQFIYYIICKFVFIIIKYFFLFQAQEDVSKNLLVIKNLLYGTADTEPLSDIVVAQLAQEMYNNNLLLMLVQNLTKIDFEVCILNIFSRYIYLNKYIHLSTIFMKHNRARRMLLKYLTMFFVGNWVADRLLSNISVLNLRFCLLLLQGK